MKMNDLLIPLHARHPLIVIDTHEDMRFVLGLLNIAHPDSFDVFFDGTHIKTLDDYYEFAGTNGKKTFEQSISDIVENKINVAGTIDNSKTRIHLFKYTDISGASDASISRAILLKEMVRVLSITKQIIIIISCAPRISDILSRDHTLFRLDLMNTGEIEGFVGTQNLERQTLIDKSGNARVWVNGKLVNIKSAYRTTYDSKEMRKIAMAMGGLTDNEMHNAIQSCFKSHGELNAVYLSNYKKQIIEKNGTLTWEETVPMEHVGGLDNCKDWIKKRVPSIYDPKAEEFGLTPPKGILLLGTPGCGKSLIARAIANMMEIPLIGMNFGSLMSRLLGESEQNMRMALDVIEASSPCVLFVDEIEKAVSGVSSSGMTDGGTLSRMFSSLLQWMQNKRKSVFVVGTCNAVVGAGNSVMMPPELLRRFDQIFFVDIPNKEEAVEILKIHLKKIKRDPDKFDLDAIASIAYRSGTNDYRHTGSEIETCIMSGLYNAYNEKRDITTGDVQEALNAAIPLSYYMKETIDALRVFGKDRCTPASGSCTIVPRLKIDRGSSLL